MHMMRTAAVSTRLLLLFVFLASSAYAQMDLSGMASNAGTPDADSISSKRTFDYIVVGGGAAGCVVAARLSEDPTVRVALVEGGGPTQRSSGGTDYVAASFGKDANGNFVVETPLTREDVPAFANTVRPPQQPWWPIVQNEPTRIIPGSQSSKALGGSMTHNNMVWIRPSAEHINSWNIPGWSYNDVLPFFRKSENVNQSISGAPQYAAYHGYSGPIGITDPVAVDKIGPAYVNACVLAGYPRNDDFNGANKNGCGFATYNIDKGIRASSLQAYLAPAFSRPNLVVFLQSTVTKILFVTPNNTNPKVSRIPIARNVQFVKDGTTYTLTARKEIILSASVFKTPQLLMLSGIGPAAELQKWGITPVVINEAVGKNFRYQHRIGGQFRYPNSSQPTLYGLAAESVLYANTKTGIFASAGIFGWLFYKSNQSLPNTDMYISISIGSQNSQVINFGITSTVPLMDPGTVTLNSSDPLDAPRVTTNTFAKREDLVTLANAVFIARNIFNQSGLRELVNGEITPGPQYDTVDKLVNYIASFAGASAHLYGTSKMRTANVYDDSWVVDTNLKVRGVAGLRIADSSVIPTLDSHTQATVIMVGERCADFIINGQ